LNFFTKSFKKIFVLAKEPICPTKKKTDVLGPQAKAANNTEDLLNGKLKGKKGEQGRLSSGFIEGVKNGKTRATSTIQVGA